MHTAIASGVAGLANVTLLHVSPVGAGQLSRVWANRVIEYTLNGIVYETAERRVVKDAHVVDAVIEQTRGYDLIVVGATEEPLFKNLLMGNVVEQIAQRAEVTVIIGKRRSGALYSLLRSTALRPARVSAASEGVRPRWK